jgi:hypothetical protein
MASISRRVRISARLILANAIDRDKEGVARRATRILKAWLGELHRITRQQLCGRLRSPLDALKMHFVTRPLPRETLVW